MKLRVGRAALTFGALAASARATAFFTHDGAVVNAPPPCTGLDGAMLAAAMTKVVALAKLSMANTDPVLRQLHWGMCDPKLVNSVFEQIATFYPLNKNFKCPGPDDQDCRNNNQAVSQPYHATSMRMQRSS